MTDQERDAIGTVLQEIIASAGLVSDVADAIVAGKAPSRDKLEQAIRLHLDAGDRLSALLAPANDD